MLEILIDRGAQIDSLNDFGHTALHLATYYQFTEGVRLLIQRGCDVNIQVFKEKSL